MTDFILNMIVPYMDKAASLVIDNADMANNKHFLYACFTTIYYHDELVELAKRTDTLYDDKMVEEAYQVAQKYWKE